MPSKSANVKNKDQYEALKDKGMSKERAAKIANSPKASEHGGKKSHSGSGQVEPGRHHRPAQGRRPQGRQGHRQEVLTPTQHHEHCRERRSWVALSDLVTLRRGQSQPPGGRESSRRSLGSLGVRPSGASSSGAISPSRNLVGSSGDGSSSSGRRTASLMGRALPLT